MANPTTNYGWPMPTSTDLVTDLPADFAAFGQPVDTSLKALNPETTLGDLAYRSATANTNTRLPIGTTGQVLAVVAGVPAWQNGTTGDIEGVTAGVGISGGGTSGTVTVTNDMATTITAAGDIVVGTGSGTYDNLPIGTTAQVLTADTTVSPYKVKWATPASGSTFVGCYIYDTNAQNCVAGTRTILTADSELYDTDGFHSTSSNTSRITIPAGKAGKYLLSGAGFFSYFSGTASCTQKLAIMKNGSLFFTFPSFAEPITGGSSAGQIASIVVDAIVTDYFELAAQQTSANTQPFQLISGSGFFSASYLGA